GRARAFDERDRDLVLARRRLDRYVREALHDLGARGGTFAVDEREVIGPAELRAEYLLEIEQHDERVLRLERARVHAALEELRDRHAVLAVGRENVLEPHAAARTRRHAVDV